MVIFGVLLLRGKREVEADMTMYTSIHGVEKVGINRSFPLIL